MLLTDRTPGTHHRKHAAQLLPLLLRDVVEFDKRGEPLTGCRSVGDRARFGNFAQQPHPLARAYSALSILTGSSCHGHNRAGADKRFCISRRWLLRCTAAASTRFCLFQGAC